MVASLAPIQSRLAELNQDPEVARAILTEGAERARRRASDQDDARCGSGWASVPVDRRITSTKDDLLVHGERRNQAADIVYSMSSSDVGAPGHTSDNRDRGGVSSRNSISSAS